MYFVRLVFILLLLMTALTSSTVLWAREHPEPSELQALGFDVCDGRPCFIGITPGVTTWNAARAILTKWGDQKESNEEFTVAANRIEVSITSLEGSVDWIHIKGIPYGGFVFSSLGNFIAKYGSPCRIMFNGDRNFVDLAYPYMMLTVFRGSRTRLELDMPIYNADLRDLSRLSQDPFDFCIYHQVAEPGIGVWSGFASWDYYQAHGLDANK